jgi:hypothetical protein
MEHTIQAQLKAVLPELRKPVDQRKADIQAVAILWLAYEQCKLPAARGIIHDAIGHITGQAESARQDALPLSGDWRKSHGANWGPVNAR